MHLTKASFKLLLLHWVSEHVQFCMHPLKVDLCFLWPSGFPMHKPHLRQTLGLIFPVQDPQAGERSVGLRPLIPWGELLQLCSSSCVSIAYIVALQIVVIFVCLWEEVSPGSSYFAILATPLNSYTPLKKHQELK